MGSRDSEPDSGIVSIEPRSEPSATYNAVVSETIDSRPRDSSYRPESPLRLTITGRRQPRRVDELDPEEREQLEAFFSEPLDEMLGDPEYELETAEVRDDAGELRFRLYGWNYGGGALFAPRGLSLVAYAAQHDLEHWNLDQRPIFHAMDAALRAKGHGFQQPLSFCWWNDECWDEVAAEEPGTLGSEPYFRARFAKHGAS